MLEAVEDISEISAMDRIGILLFLSPFFASKAESNRPFELKAFCAQTPATSGKYDVVHSLAPP